jgi:hypothetical protein
LRFCLLLPPVSARPHARPRSTPGRLSVVLTIPACLPSLSRCRKAAEPSGRGTGGRAVSMRQSHSAPDLVSHPRVLCTTATSRLPWTHGSFWSFQKVTETRKDVTCSSKSQPRHAVQPRRQGITRRGKIQRRMEKGLASHQLPRHISHSLNTRRRGERVVVEMLWALGLQWPNHIAGMWWGRCCEKRTGVHVREASCEPVLLNGC